MNAAPSKFKNERPAPFSIRFSETELTELRRRAGKIPLSAFIRDTVLDPENVKPRARRQSLSLDTKLLGQILASIGNAGISKDLSLMARAASQGALPVTPEMEARLELACAAVMEMRFHLLSALGIRLIGEAKEDADDALEGALP